MKLKIKILLCVLFLGNGIVLAQGGSSFYIEVPDLDYIPIVTHDNRGKRINSFKTKNKSLNALVNSYEIYSSVHVFKSSLKVSLQNIYLIHCNDIQLMYDLSNNFSMYYPRIEDAYTEMLVVPDDFGISGGYTGSDQDELSYIRAQEVWDIFTTGSSDIIIGISDNSVRLSHEDITGKVQHVFGSNFPNNISFSTQHGTWVASVAAANTNNSLGLASIGYDSSIYSATHSGVNGVDTLSLMPGVKVINTAWISSSMPEVYDEVVEDRNIVVVGSAGNSSLGSPEAIVNPAAFKNVISVSAIGHHNDTFFKGSNFYEVFLDSHEYKRNGIIRTYQHNDSVDVVAPAYGIQIADPRIDLDHGYLDNAFGTSFSSPMVSGTIALMFDVNYCLKPKEIETILKLTAVIIDTLPQNLPYFGKLGAGKLDAYEAVKMSKDMADAFGTVEVKNRILYRPWFYKLATAPYEIKMTNNEVSGGSKLKFRARNNIEILGGDYSPDSGGYIDLQIDENLVLNGCTPRPSSSSRQSNFIVKPKNKESSFIVVPTLIENDVSVLDNNKLDIEKMAYIKVYDFFSIEVFAKDKITTNKVTLNLNSLYDGIYILKVFDSNGQVLHTQKIVKK